MMLSRRALGWQSLASLAIVGGCASTADATATDGRLTARILSPASDDERRGRFRFSGWPGPLVYVPPGIDATTPTPFVLALRGGGSNADWTLNRILPTARERNVIVLAPEIEGYTWDAIRDFRDHRRENRPPRFGEDTARVDASLQQLFSSFEIDPSRAAIAGFSDGASYALSLGPRNQNLFSHIMAFSPGGVVPFDDPPRARIFVSHGRQDPMLPYANTSGGVVPGFRTYGFDVTFESFDGVHHFRDEEIAKAFDWFLAG